MVVATVRKWCGRLGGHDSGENCYCGDILAYRQLAALFLGPIHCGDRLHCRPRIGMVQAPNGSIPVSRNSIHAEADFEPQHGTCASYAANWLGKGPPNGRLPQPSCFLALDE